MSLPGSGGPLKGPSLESVNVAADTVWVVGGVTYEASRSWYDANQQPVSQWGPDGRRHAVELSRDGHGDGPAVLWAYLAHHPVRYLRRRRRSDTATVNGTVQDSCQSQFSTMDTQRVTHLFAVSGITLGSVHLDKTGTNPYPLSGTMTWNLGVDRLRSSNPRRRRGALRAATAIVTFNGTANPQVVVNGQYHYTLNLINGAVTPIAS